MLIEGSKQVDPPPPADSESDDGDVIDNSDDIDFEEGMYKLYILYIIVYLYLYYIFILYTGQEINHISI